MITDVEMNDVVDDRRGNARDAPELGIDQVAVGHVLEQVAMPQRSSAP